MPRWQKLLLPQILLVLSLVGVYIYRQKPYLKKIFLTSASCFVGLSLAIFGQVYQSGADTYELFLYWAALIVAWVLTAQSTVLWFIWLTLVHIALALYLDHVDYSQHFLNSSILSLLPAVFAISLIGAEKYFPSLKHPVIWFSLVTTSLNFATYTLIIYIFKDYSDSDLTAILAVLSISLVIVSTYIKHRQIKSIATQIPILLSLDVLVWTCFFWLCVESGDGFREVGATALVMTLVTIGLLRVNIWWLHRQRDSSSPIQIPWFFSILNGIGGLVAGITITVFVIALFSRSLDHSTGLSVAVFFGTIGLILNNVSENNPFIQTLALSLSTCGYIFFTVYLGENTTLGGAAFGWIILSSSLYYFYKNDLHRLSTTLMALLLSAYWLWESDMPPVYVLVLLQLGLGTMILICFNPSSPKVLKPAGYSAVIILLGLFFTPVYQENRELIDGRIAALVFATATLVIISLYNEEITKKHLAITILCTVLIALVTSPGLTIAITLLAIGFWQKELVLSSLATLFIPIFLIEYYYSMEVTLWTKSVLLVSAAIIFLGIRKALTTTFDNNREATS